MCGCKKNNTNNKVTQAKVEKVVQNNESQPIKIVKRVGLYKK